MPFHFSSTAPDQEDWAPGDPQDVSWATLFPQPHAQREPVQLDLPFTAPPNDSSEVPDLD